MWAWECLHLICLKVLFSSSLLSRRKVPVAPPPATRLSPAPALRRAFFCLILIFIRILSLPLSLSPSPTLTRSHSSSTVYTHRRLSLHYSFKSLSSRYCTLLLTSCTFTSARSLFSVHSFTPRSPQPDSAELPLPLTAIQNSLLAWLLSFWPCFGVLIYLFIFGYLHYGKGLSSQWKILEQQAEKPLIRRGNRSKLTRKEIDLILRIARFGRTDYRRK